MNKTILVAIIAALAVGFGVGIGVMSVLDADSDDDSKVILDSDDDSKVILDSGADSKVILDSGDDSAIPIQDTSEARHLIDVQIPALVQTHKIQSDLLEGVEEAFAYLILDDTNEKKEFFKKMDDFENRVNNYIKFAPHNETDDIDDDESETLDAIIKAQKNLVASATTMFESYERGNLSLKTVQAFEDDIDEIVPLVDRLIDDEIEDINEHVHKIEG